MAGVSAKANKHDIASIFQNKCVTVQDVLSTPVMVSHSRGGMALVPSFNDQAELKPAHQTVQIYKMPLEDGEEPVTVTVILSLHLGSTLRLTVTAACNPPVC